MEYKNFSHPLKDRSYEQPKTISDLDDVYMGNLRDFSVLKKNSKEPERRPFHTSSEERPLHILKTDGLVWTGDRYILEDKKDASIYMPFMVGSLVLNDFIQPGSPMSTEPLTDPNFSVPASQAAPIYNGMVAEFGPVSTLPKIPQV